MITTIGVFTNHGNAEGALKELRAFGVEEKSLSYVYKGRNGEIKDSQSGDKVGAGAAQGATTGAVIGGIAGLVVANGILPGLGTLFVAGPLAAALGFTGAAATAVAGAATGAAAGGLLGGLAKLGVAKDDVELYEKHVREGDVLVITHNSPPSVQDIFLTHGAVEVRQYQENE
jgi:hypothetical protein